MFIIVEMKDTVRIPPHSFNNELLALSSALDEKFSNKVLKDVGLVISLYEVVNIGEEHIYPGDGAAHAKVTFKLVVFRPCLGQVLVGKIKSCNQTGIQVTLGFFDDIFIVAPLLQHPSIYDEKEGMWSWKFGEHSLPMDPADAQDEIRFRVTSVQFPPQSQRKPFGPQEPDAVPDALPMHIMAAVNEPGLGMLSWWTQNSAQETAV